MPDISPLVNEILSRARSLEERVAMATDARPGSQTTEWSDLLAPWIKAYSPGNPDALLRRLGWDAITPDIAAAALGPSLSNESTPDDRSLSNDILDFAQAARSRSRDLPIEGNEIPFYPILEPFVRLAVEKLGQRTAPERLFERAALGDLLRQLAIDLSWWTFPSLWTRYESARAGGVSFGEFSQAILDRPLEFYVEHAALLRHLLSLTSLWVDSTAELSARLDADRQEIADTFDIANSRVVRVKTGLSDRHSGGRQVSILEFHDSRRVVYKPMSCRSLLRFNELIAWYASRGGNEAPRTIRVLDHETYGWVEFVDQDALETQQQVALYFTKAGALLCLAWLLGGRDLHMDNVICTADGPVIVDAEVFLQPRWTEDSAAHPGAIQLARQKVSSSVIGTGMLSFPQENAQGQVYDIGGLCGQGGYVSPAPRRVFRHVNTDDMGFVEEHPTVDSIQNVVRFGGRIEPPEDRVDEIVTGFTKAFETLLAHRDELTSDNGPLRRFRDARSRLLFRPSNQYATLLQTMTAPSFARSGLTGSLLVESLARVFNREDERPELWSLVREERRALENLDIPIFTVSCGATTIETEDGDRIDGLIAKSGVDELISRVEQLDRDALVEQVRLIRATLVTGAAHADLAEEEQPVSGIAPGNARVFIDDAVRFADSLLAASIRGADGGITWIAPEFVKITSIADLGATYYLYSGVTGPSIFLAALGSVTGDERFVAPARAAWSTLERLVESGDARPVREHLRLGICNGVGSIVYAATLASEMLADPSLLDVARGFAELIDEDRLRREEEFDIEGGLAGAVVALVRLFEVTAERKWLALAGVAVDRLTALAISDETGTWWPHDPKAPPLAGMSHGAAGTAFALATFMAAADERERLKVVNDAMRWERTVFDPSSGNWPVRTSDGRRIEMVAWCHGACGIGLTRIATREVTAGAFDEDLDRAIRTVTGSGLHPVDHLCCGNAGRIDFLLEAAMATGRVELLDEARRRTASMVARASERNGFSLTTEAGDNDLLRPGFFRGLSGIGYTLLRAADPASLPSVARFDIRRNA